jgi:AraC-like DNA-binding protein
MELTFIQSGRGRRYVGDAVEDYSSGDCVLIGPYLPHTWVSYGKGIQSAFVTQFGGEWLTRLIAAAPEFARVGSLLQRCQRGIRFERAERTGLKESMAAMMGCFGVERLTMLLKILDVLARSRGGKPLASPTFVPPTSVMDSRLAMVHAYTQQHLSDSITQEQAAEITGLTPAAFCRFFKRSTGRTFVAHLHELRIGRACQLLVETERAITEACFESGFGNVSNFNRIFRRLKGISPRQYQAKFKEAESAIAG